MSFGGFRCNSLNNTRVLCVFVWRVINETHAGASLKLYGPAFFERLFRLVAQDMAHDHIRFTNG